MNPGSEIIVAQERDYRSYENDNGFVCFRAMVETSDLYIKAHSNLRDKARSFIVECRRQIEDSIQRRPEFLTSFSPICADPLDSPTSLRMIDAARKAGVGPMAAVAGAVAEFVGRNLLPFSDEIIVENGGDIFIHVKKPMLVGINAGKSIMSGKIGIKIGPTLIPLGICTSSATVGPSTSLGKADAATILAHNVSLADAVATGMGNMVKTKKDLQHAVGWAMGIEGVLAALAILEDKMAVAGEVELSPLGQ
ncbi:MAG: UPF0280 family protein [Desulfomonilaceae bacterium]